MATSLIPFLFHKLILTSEGIQIVNARNNIHHLRWSEIGKYKEHEVLQIFKIYDKQSKLVYAVDFKAENFPLLSIQFRQRFAPIAVAVHEPQVIHENDLKEVLNSYPLPYRVDIAHTRREYDALLASAAPKCVVLLGGLHDIENHSISPRTLATSPAEIIALAATFDVSEWASAETIDNARRDLGNSLGRWPTDTPERSLSVHPSGMDAWLSGDTCAAVLPTTSSWSAPAYLPFADLDQCPAPYIHVALAKRWHEQFGAEIVAITSYTVEFKVGRPPTNRAACEQLAWEHLLYAPECLGEDAILDYAHSLKDTATWFFLWD
ncbi:DUF4253 domain-containing protein [Sulfuriferula multivorans]|nr:DUF4253 domain-containing protein [Sulfuriferula multivorans]